ncbi:MAG: excinuclease ABC subunit UvrC [Clostridia bacterium]|nr:excinuclease ABC subunit UvrC [Clostridia bacterium]
MDIKKKLSSLPLCPGIYIMKNSDGKVIYVGKSKVLKNRVSQYFVNLASHSPKTRAMVSNVADFDYIITDSEAEALALECNLIKKYKPKYNILLKDDKQYPYIKITAAEKFPRIFITREVKKDGSLYFGPYMTASNLKKAVEEVRKAFKIRSCKKAIEDPKDRPCLYFRIGQCSAPCAGKITEEKYKKSITDASDVLGSRYDALEKKLKEEMLQASESLDFEKAALLRDKLQSIAVLKETQKVSSATEDDMDFIGIYKEGNDYCIQVFYYRNGNAVKAEHFTLKNEFLDKNEVAEGFVKQFYFAATEIPAEILISEEFDDKEAVEQWLSEISGHKVRFNVPKRGKKAQILQMVISNAKEALYSFKLAETKGKEKQNRILSQITEFLNLSHTPFRIESYDISNFSGASSVGAEIVYVNAVPKKSLYRKFNIKTVEGANDYDSMCEVIFRRINEAYKEEDLIKSGELSPDKAKFLPLPDLILLDGGKGHVSAVKMMLDTLGEEIPVFGLVKDKTHRTRGVTDESREFEIEKRSELFRFFSGIQDEVHRFAITAYRNRHQRDALSFGLEEISGVGPANRTKLLKSFGSVKQIKKASIEELSAVVSSNVAKNVYEYFNKG